MRRISEEDTYIVGDSKIGKEPSDRPILDPVRAYSNMIYPLTYNMGIAPPALQNFSRASDPCF